MEERVLDLMLECLERPVVIEGEELVIPADAKILYKSWAE
jgi:hypothetical protein